MARLFVAANPDYALTGSALITAAPLTMCAWVKLTAASTVARTILCIQNNASAADRNRWYLGMGTTEAMRASTCSASGISTGAGGILAAGTWAHAAAVFASDASRIAYKDGTAGTEETTSRVPSGVNETSLGVQSVSSGSFSLPWDGDIAEAAIWNVALTASEIASLAKGYSPQLIRPGSLVHYWPCIGRSTNEVDKFGGATATVTGAVQSSHPRIIYPRSQRVFPAAAVVGAFKAAWVRQASGVIGAR